MKNLALRTDSNGDSKEKLLHVREKAVNRQVKVSCLPADTLKPGMRSPTANAEIEELCIKVEGEE